MWSVLELRRTKDRMSCKPGSHQFCVICLEDPDDKDKETSQLQCGHTFCAECIDQLICFNAETAKCPLCRKPLVKVWSIRKFSDYRTLGTTIAFTFICLCLVIFVVKWSSIGETFDRSLSAFM